jgi:hypothetical protein
MSPTLHWIAAPAASPLHAASMQALSRPLVDRELAARLSPIVAETASDVEQAQLDREQFWRQLVPWGAGLAPPPSLELCVQLAAALQTCDASIADGELLLRGGPLRDAWEARGPGLWHSLRRLTFDNALAPTASVILVRPVLGGGGEVFPERAALSFEAMLANPLRDLPEIVRLGWLLAQLRFATESSTPKQRALALIPVLLAAAEEVEIARCDESTLRVAIRAWHLANRDEEASSLAAHWWAWWQSQRQQPRSLEAALSEVFD